MAGRVTVLTSRVEPKPIDSIVTIWRKQVLAIGSLNYNGRKLNFTRDYIQNLVKSSRDRAFDAVPLQLAASDNRHTNDPSARPGRSSASKPQTTGSAPPSR